eukprot:748187-Hanusia_phi.AAC.2
MSVELGTSSFAAVCWTLKACLMLLCMMERAAWSSRSGGGEEKLGGGIFEERASNNGQDAEARKGERRKLTSSTRGLRGGGTTNVQSLDLLGESLGGSKVSSGQGSA